MAPKPPPRHSDFVLRDIRDTVASPSPSPLLDSSPTSLDAAMRLGPAAKARYSTRGSRITRRSADVALHQLVPESAPTRSSAGGSVTM